MGVHVDLIELIYYGRKMNNEKSIEEYNLQNLATIYV